VGFESADRGGRNAFPVGIDRLQNRIEVRRFVKSNHPIGNLAVAQIGPRYHRNFVGHDPGSRTGGLGVFDPDDPPRSRHRDGFLPLFEYLSRGRAKRPLTHVGGGGAHEHHGKTVEAGAADVGAVGNITECDFGGAGPQAGSYVRVRDEAAKLSLTVAQCFYNNRPDRGVGSYDKYRHRRSVADRSMRIGE